MKEYVNIIKEMKITSKRFIQKLNSTTETIISKDLIYIFVLLCEGMMYVIYHYMRSYYNVAFEGRRKAFESLHKKVSYTR